MLEFDFHIHCCGCGACSSVCPTGAISMQQADDGFLYPLFDASKCVQCGMCDRVCAHVNKRNSSSIMENICAWRYSSSDDSTKMRSTSGGAFYEIAKKALERDEYVCGCIWDEHFIAKHIISNSVNNLEKMQGSKYVQSDVGETYKEIISYLKQGKRVVFSGTPCQATAIHNIIMNYNNGKYREQLTTIAILCHGVSSPIAWESFKKWIEEKNKARLISVNFRDKSKEGYKKSYCKYVFDSGKVVFTPTYLPTSKYIEATLVYNLALRESCTHCDCKGINEACDVIIGDWYEEYKGEGALGTSCIVAFTERGKEIVKSSLSNLKPLLYNDILRKNNMIEKSTTRSDNRDIFLYNVEDIHSWDKVEQLYPNKYKYKKILVKTGLYDIIKKVYKGG